MREKILSRPILLKRDPAGMSASIEKKVESCSKISMVYLKMSTKN